MNLGKKQKGMSFWGIVVILALVGFFASAAFKLIPHYMDNRSLEKIVLDVDSQNAAGAGIRTVDEFYRHIEKGMQVNSIYDLNPKDIMKVKVENGVFVVDMNYEQRDNLVKNIDLVVHFDKEYRVRAQ